MKPLVSKNVMKKILAAFMMMVIPGTAVFAIEAVKIQQPRYIRLPQGDIGWIIHAVRINGRYLAVVYGRAQREQRRKALEVHEGSISYVAPAWFDEGWKLIQLGEPKAVHGDLLEMNFTPKGGPIDYRPLPQIFVRKPFAEKCPYLWVTAYEVHCLEADLTLKKGVKTPVPARGLLVWNGQVYLKGLAGGYLLHMYDWRRGRIKHSFLSVEQIEAALSKAGVDYDPADFSVIPVKRPSGSGKEGQGDEKIIPRAFRHPRPFNFDIIFTGDRVWVTLVRPLAAVSWSWPELKRVKVHAISDEKLPTWVHRFHAIQLVRSWSWRWGMLNFYELRRGVTYGEIRLEQPQSQAEIKAEWERDHPDEVLTPDTIVSEEDRILFIYIQQNGQIRIFDGIEWGSEFSDLPWSDFLTAPFLIGDKFYWTMTARDKGQMLTAVATLKFP